ncbi:MAG: hypothetical protein JHD16_07075 [Solirubrobacteraceae bacterium]|nr:hypothetical protein [Solirubrobacteraceae bacterium]
MPGPVSARPFRVAAVAVLVALAAPVSASAKTTLSVGGGTITITGDDLPSRIVNGGITTGVFEEQLAGAEIVAAPGGGCVQLTATSVDCGVADAGRSLVANLGGGDDFYKFAGDPIQTIDAGEGNDTVETGYGKDTVAGGPGNDDLSGGRGDDVLDGGVGDDKVDGWDGSDSVTGGPGRDTLLGDGGTVYTGNNNDRIFARDGEVDTVDCGGGADLAEIDANDVFSACSNVDRPGSGGNTTPGANGGTGGTGGTGGSGGAGGSGGTPLTVASSLVKRQAPKALSQGRKLKVELTATDTCSGKVAIDVSKSEAKRLKLGTTKLTLGTSAPSTVFARVAKTITVGVQSKYRSKLARARSLKVVLTVSCAANDGRSFTGSVKATLKR